MRASLVCVMAALFEQRRSLNRQPSDKFAGESDRIWDSTTRRFLSAHAAIYNIFDVQRHLILRRTLRIFHATAFAQWRIVGHVA